MLFITHFYSLSMKTPTLVETNNLETFQVFAKMIWLSEVPVSGSRCKDLTLISLSSSVKWLNIKTLYIIYVMNYVLKKCKCQLK